MVYSERAPNSAVAIRIVIGLKRNESVYKSVTDSYIFFFCEDCFVFLQLIFSISFIL